ncbi:MAG: hypothetical protein IJ193_07050 [Bacilli bacterium]|nr:hypothetical protein [Bacilli bacterium]
MYPYNDMRNCSNGTPQMMQGQDGERFFWAPFVVGGLAGTALGYGIANNNQINQGYYPHPYYQPYPVYMYPSQNTYYF